MPQRVACRSGELLVRVGHHFEFDGRGLVPPLCDDLVAKRVEQLRRRAATAIRAPSAARPFAIGARCQACAVTTAVLLGV